MKFSSFFDFFSSRKKEEIVTKEIGESEGSKGLDSAYLAAGAVSEQPFGELSYSELRDTYLQSSSVRPCVDSISRYISSLPWIVRPKVGGDVFHVAEVKNFLMDPNSNKESLRTILAKLMVDLLIIDAGVIEKVRSRSGKLLEIYARDGSTFTPIYDKHGSLLEYEQSVSQEDVIFKPDEIIYSQLYPRTWNFYGTPIIETIVDEVATLMFSISNISETFQKDEIPPGILTLDKVGEIAYKRLKEDLTSEKGSIKKNLKILRNIGSAHWIEFKKPFREMQLVELNQQIENIVHKNFGIKENMEISGKMILPLTQTINYFFNREIISEFYDDVYFKLIPLVTDEKEAKANESRSKAIKNLVGCNVLDVQEARKLIGEEFLLPEESLD